MTLEDCYQFFANAIFASIQDAWSESWIEAEVENDWGHYKATYKNACGELKAYVLKYKQNDTGILDILLRMRELMKGPDQAAWNRIRFWMSAEGDFKIDVSYPDTISTTT